METLVAFSLACNIIQVIDASVTLAKQIGQIRKNGATDNYADVEAQAHELQSLLLQLKKSEVDRVRSQSADAIELQIESIINSCDEIAAELCTQLGMIKSSGSHRGAILALFRALRSRTDIEKLQTKLKQYRELLMTTVLVSLRQKIQDQELSQRHQFGALDTNLQLLLHNSETATRTLEELFKEFRDKDFSDEWKARGLSEEGRIDTILGFDIAPVKHQILNSLTFSDMYLRINQIADNEPDTFAWIFHPPSDIVLDEPRQRIRDWLSSELGFFWLEGRAGSGKSTLMKFLWENDLTVETIKAAHASQDCVILKYSFWLAGNTAQRSVAGCYMSLLHQLLSYSQGTLSALIGDGSHLKRKRENGDWSESELQKILVQAVAITASDISVAIFIDGLDEIAERQEYPRIVQLIKSLSGTPRVKVCVSSRPESYWLQAFQTESKTRLQDLVESDIEIYARSRLAECSHTTSFTAFESKYLLSLITVRAEGVFLWARFAMNHVLQALDGLASYEEVIETVEGLPVSIEGLYAAMITKQGMNSPRVRQEAALYLKAVLSGIGLHLTDFAAFRAKMQGLRFMDDEYTLRDLYENCEQLEIRIPHICAGMIECVGRDRLPDAPDDYGTGMRKDPRAIPVAFMHRTVMDFLANSEAGKNLLRDCSISDEDLLQCGVEASLKCSLLHKSQLILREIAHTLEKMFSAQHSIHLDIRAESITKGVQALVATVSRHGINTSWVGSDAEQLPSNDQIQYDIFRNDPADRGVFWYDGHAPPPSISYIDIPGCSLAYGLCDYVKHLTNPVLHSINQSDISLTQMYKDYLLFCAITGSRRSYGCVEFALTLMDYGANPFAELFLPVWEPRKVCAAAQLVCIVTSLRAPHLKSKSFMWNKLCCRVTDMCDTMRTTWAFSVVVWPEESNVALPAFPSSENCSSSDVGFLLEVNIQRLLQGLTSSSEHLVPGAQSFPLFLQALVGPLCLARFNLITYSRGLVSVLNDQAQLATLSDQQSLHIRTEFERIFQGRSTSRFAAWEEFQAILEPLYENPDSTTRIDCQMWLRERGYIVEETDPRLYTGPIPRFEGTDTVPGEIDRSVLSMNVGLPEVDIDSESSSLSETALVFYDAEE